LDPTRLRQLRRSPADVLTALEVERTDELDDELRFLVDWSITAPDSLPTLTRAVATRLQLTIARSELGAIRDAVVDHADDTIEQDRGAFTEAFDRAHRDGPPDDATIATLVGSMRIGEETVAGEFGSNLTLRIATRAAGVSINSLTSGGTGIPVAPRLLRPLRAPLQGTNAIVGVLAGGSPLARALTAFLVAVSGAIVAVRVAGADVNPVVLTLAILTFAITGAVSLLRARGRWRMAAGWVAFAAVVGVVLLGSALSGLLFDRTAPTPIGSLHSGDLIVVTDPGTIRVIDGTGDDALVDDITLAPGSRIELRDVGRADLARAVELQDATWKRVGFTNRFSVVNIVAFALGVVLLLRPERRARLGWLLTALVLIGAALLNASTQALERVMTGADPGPGGGGAKRIVVDAATWLHDQRAGLLVVLFVAVGVVIGAVWRSGTAAARAAGRRERAPGAAGGRGRPSSG
jgi:hypothetical protein